MYAQQFASLRYRISGSWVYIWLNRCNHVK
nr:MAG TPA: hypothetical protein [Caudoviricetes sp.]